MASEGDDRYPVQRIREARYELVIIWGSPLEDAEDDNVDIEVRTLDGRFSASVFTLRNVVSLLDKARANGRSRPRTSAAPTRSSSTSRSPRACCAGSSRTVRTGDVEGWERLHVSLDEDDE